jgi:PncC family amidohydrolase
MNETIALEHTIARLALARGLTVAVAESCTGGLVAYRLTEVPGSSVWFKGGIVAYTVDIKHRVVGVPRAVLEHDGVVSRATALQLARGARRVCRADVGIGLTGYAGPDGGTNAAPIGTVYLGLAATDAHKTKRGFWRGDRHCVRVAAAEAALRLLRDYLDLGQIAHARHRRSQVERAV